MRERRAARVQQLESQLASITKSDDSGRVKKLVDANSKLRHTLLNTRKKLASLSATAAQLGDQLKLVLEDHGDLPTILLLESLLNRANRRPGRRRSREEKRSAPRPDTS